MISYWCPACGLYFSVGQFPSRRWGPGIMPDIVFDTASLVCVECGVEYHARHTHGEKLAQQITVTTEFDYFPVHMTINLRDDMDEHEMDEAFKNAIGSEPVHCCTLRTTWRPVFNPPEMICCSCGAKGSLVDSWEEGRSCPRCGTGKPKNMGEITIN